MKKNLWVLLALSALIAMFVIAGCAPKPTTPTPTPTPTASPTTPPADTAAPKVVSTDVYKFYGVDTCSTCVDPCVTVTTDLYEYPICCDEGNNFKVVITFDENIDPLKSSCMLNPSNWTISIINSGRYSTTEKIEIEGKEFTNPQIFAQINDVEIDGKKVVLTGAVIEVGINYVYPDPADLNNRKDIYYGFCGLICNTDDAKAYAAAVNGAYNGFPVVGVIDPPAKADEVKWTLASACVVADELGNVNCGYSGSDCCLESTCDTCDEGCPFEDPTCPTCVNPCE